MKKENGLLTRRFIICLKSPKLYLLLLIGCLRDFQHSTVKQTDVREFCWNNPLALITFGPDEG